MTWSNSSKEAWLLFRQWVALNNNELKWIALMGLGVVVLGFARIG